MQTGDGLLVRLRPVAGSIAPDQLGRMADAAGRFGNGVLEVTRRGNLQIRGLTPESAVEFAEAVDALGVNVMTGVPIEAGPLAGLDAREIADPRPLAGAIRESIAEAGLASRLGPKVSVVVDGGGALPMDDVAADVRLAACDEREWLLSVGGIAKESRPLGVLAEKEAANAVLSLLGAIATKGLSARGKDLRPQGLDGTFQRNIERHNYPVGTFLLKKGSFALGVGLPFGQASAEALRFFAENAAACGAPEIRFAPGRALLALGLAAEECERLREEVRALGFVTDAADPRLFIAACAGSPACASAFIDTKDIAASVARSAADLLDGSFILHVSGCPKGCARPPAPGLSLAGIAPERCAMLLDGHDDAAIAQACGGDAAAFVAELALLFRQRRRQGETAKSFLDRWGGARLASALCKGK